MRNRLCEVSLHSLYVFLSLIFLCTYIITSGAYQLDLGRREERIMVKTFAQLATAEPGDNLPSVTFR